MFLCLEWGFLIQKVHELFFQANFAKKRDEEISNFSVIKTMDKHLLKKCKIATF